MRFVLKRIQISDGPLCSYMKMVEGSDIYLLLCIIVVGRDGVVLSGIGTRVPEITRCAGMYDRATDKGHPLDKRLGP